MHLDRQQDEKKSPQQEKGKDKHYPETDYPIDERKPGSPGPKKIV